MSFARNTRTAAPECSSGVQIQSEFYARIGAVRQFRELFEYVPGVSFFVKDERSRLVAASQSVVERLGFATEAELVGSSDHDHFPPHVAESFIRDDRLVMQSGQPLVNRVEVWYDEQRLLDWIVTTKLPVRDLQGAIIGVMGTFRTYQGSQKSISPDPAVNRVVEYVRERQPAKISVAELAAHAGVSARQLHRKFHDALGLSVQEFLVKTRIQSACQMLLETDRSIADIAIEFGFCDQSAFTQAFKKQIGVTPFRFRRRHRVG